MKQRRRKRRVTVKQQRKQHWTRSVYVCSLFVVCLATRRMPSLRFSLSILLLVYLASLPKLNLASILTLTLARSIFTRSLAEMIELGESLARTLCPSSSPPLSLFLSHSLFALQSVHSSNSCNFPPSILCTFLFV